MSEHGPVFATTHWSVVLTAGGDDAALARDALSTLCAAYWYPLYAYLRRRGSGPEEAQDLVQGFFADLLERGSLATADRERGRFRAFLLGSLAHFVANEHARERALKRGGGQAPLSLDFAAAEDRFSLEPADARTPEAVFEATWAHELLERVIERLRAEYVADGRRELYEHLLPCLAGDVEARPYASIAAELELSEGAVKTAAHRLRARFRALFRSEIAHTVRDPGDVEDEIRDLFGALSGKAPEKA